MTIYDLWQKSDKTASLNACSQALKEIFPCISRERFFDLLGIPKCRTSINRYWVGSYNITDWDFREEEERFEALYLVGEAISRRAGN